MQNETNCVSLIQFLYIINFPCHVRKYLFIKLTMQMAEKTKCFKNRLKCSL